MIAGPTTGLARGTGHGLLQEAAGTALNFTSTSDFFRRLGHEAYFFARFGEAAQAGLSFRSDSYTSLPVVTDDGLIGYKEPIPNPPIEEGRMRSLLVTARFSPGGPLFPSRPQEREWYLQPSLYGADLLTPDGFRAEATFEWAGGALGGDYRFRRLIARLRDHRRFHGRFALDTRLLVGLTGGDPPRPKRFVIGGLGTLRGYPARAFAGEDMAVVNLEWSFHPGSPWPALFVFYDGATVGDGWKSGSGIGLRWPVRRGLFLSAELGVPWEAEEARKARALVKLQVPF